MKKIGVISDVHGNIQALRVVLDYLKNNGCQEIIHTGDVVDIGANSRECLDLLLQNNVLCIMGNHDRNFVLNETAHAAFSHVSERHKKYVFDSVAEYRDVVAKFPLFIQRNLGGKNVIFEHYCRAIVPAPNGYPFCIIENHPSVERFDEMYQHYDCDVVFFGHKHEPCDFQGKHTYVDVGSVGCHPQPLATGIIISYDETHFQYERFALPYDMETTRKAMTDGTLPDGEYMYNFYYAHDKNLPDLDW